MVKRWVKNAVNLDSGVYFETLVFRVFRVVKLLVKNAVNLDSGA